MIDWQTERSLADVTAEDLEVPGVVFRHGDALYRTTGTRVGQGGMGFAFHLERRRDDGGDVERAVAKVLREEFLAQVEHDGAARQHFERNLAVVARIRSLSHPNLLPILAAEPIRGNFLLVTPFSGEPLISLVSQEKSAPRERVRWLIDAVRGLAVLHRSQVAHCDVTLQNVLIARSGAPEGVGVLFDFDLAVALDALGGTSYTRLYEGRIVGSPDYSVTPELLDDVLGESQVSPRRDVYAVGTALFALFTDVSIYGDVADLSTLFQRIGEGVVRRGRSRIQFPEQVPAALRRIIIRCVERDPQLRYADAEAVLADLEAAEQQLAGPAESRRRTTLAYVRATHQVKLAEVLATRPDTTVSPEEIGQMQAVLARQGYLVAKSLGRVKGHPIYLAMPDPVLVATGRFFEANAYRKIVTAIDLGGRADADAIVATWFGRIRPILDQVRQAALTVLYKVALDKPAGMLLLFTEYIDDPRFGTDLLDKDLLHEEVLGVGRVVADQIARLHAHGLAHNNVTLTALLFKGLRDSWEARPVLVGLVDPRFSEPGMADDVRQLAAILAGLLARCRMDDQPTERRDPLAKVLARIEAHARGPAEREPAREAIATLTATIEEGLGVLSHNFDVVRRCGGDPIAFARDMIRHTLYRRLWG